MSRSFEVPGCSGLPQRLMAEELGSATRPPESRRSSACLSADEQARSGLEPLRLLAPAEAEVSCGRLDQSAYGVCLNDEPGTLIRLYPPWHLGR